MERLSDILRGCCTVRVVGAEPARFLELCANEGREFWGVYPEDDFTFVLSMRQGDAEELPRLAEKSFCEAVLIEKLGGRKTVKRLRHRVLLWALPPIFLALLVCSSLFVWKIEIEGNKELTEKEILHALEDSGVDIGSFWPSFNGEIIRSRVMARLPELKGMGFSVLGSRVQVEVREATKIPELFDDQKFCNVVAGQAGIIEELYALRGTGKFVPGQAAVGGDILISGVVESLLADTRLVHAEGSALARTWHEISGILPLEYTQKQYTGKTRNRFALVIGDKRINFYGNSGISDTKCDNIITEYVAGIGGLFSLPLSVVREHTAYYEPAPALYSETEASRLLEEMLRQELSDRLGSDGTVVSAEFTMSVVDGTAVGTLRAECRQNIAKEKPLTQEEINAAEKSDSAQEEQNTR